MRNKFLSQFSRHCVDYKTPESISIVAGTYSLHSGGDYRNATEILIHPGWNRTAKMHDIALIKVSAFSLFLEVLLVPMKRPKL